MHEALEVVNCHVNFTGKMKVSPAVLNGLKLAASIVHDGKVHLSPVKPRVAAKTQSAGLDICHTRFVAARQYLSGKGKPSL